MVWPFLPTTQAGLTGTAPCRACRTGRLTADRHQLVSLSTPPSAQPKAVGGLPGLRIPAGYPVLRCGLRATLIFIPFLTPLLLTKACGETYNFLCAATAFKTALVREGTNCRGQRTLIQLLPSLSCSSPGPAAPPQIPSGRRQLSRAATPVSCCRP